MNTVKLIEGSPGQRTVGKKERIVFITIGVATVILLLPAFSKTALDQHEEQNDSLSFRRVHHKALTLDAHIDLRPDFNTDGNEATQDTPGQFDLPKLERGDLDG